MAGADGRAVAAEALAAVTEGRAGCHWNQPRTPWQTSAVAASYRRRRLWGITEVAIDAFDALVATAMSPGGCDEDEARQRRLLTVVLDGLVGDRDGGGRALIEASPMWSGFPTATEARAWIVDLLAAAARQQQQPWWQGCDDQDPSRNNLGGLATSSLVVARGPAHGRPSCFPPVPHGDPAIHGRPFERLRSRTALARVVLDRRIELRLSQQVVADACRVVQGEVQAWEAGARIPTDAELDALARVLDLDRDALAGTETGSAVHRNELSAEQQAELDALFWGSDTKVPDLAARFGLEGRSVHKLVTPVPAGAECPDCGTEMVFTSRGQRRYNFADCPTCRRTRNIGRQPRAPAPLGP